MLEHLSAHFERAQREAAAAGLSLRTNAVMDASRRDLRGRSAVRGLATVEAELDLTPLAGIGDGVLFARFQAKNGGDGGTLLGDLQGFSNIDAENFRHVAEVWLQQHMLRGHVRLKAGRIDASTEFGFNESAGHFLNASMGFIPTIFAAPIYPTAAPGAALFVDLPAGLYHGVALFAGRGTAGLPQVGGGSFAIAEAGIRNPLPLPGSYEVGVWRHSGAFERVQGGIEHGAGGWHVLIEQVLWQQSAASNAQSRAVAGFAQLGKAPSAVAELDLHIAAGLSSSGGLPGRADDGLGLGLTWVRRSRAFGGGSELSWETYYDIALTSWLHARPDVQYVARRMGPGRPAESGVVATLRISFAP